MDGKRMAALAGVLAAAGCGNVVTDQPVLDQSGAALAGQALTSGIEAAARQLPLPVMVPDLGCAALSGDQSDSDGDLIPARGTYTWQGCPETRAPLYQGTLTVADDDPYAAYAFHGSFDLTVTTHSTSGLVSVAHRTGTFQGAQGPVSEGSIQYLFSESLAGSTSFQDSKAGSHAADESYQLCGRFLPLTGWTPGQFAGEALWAVSGQWSLDLDGARAMATLTAVKPIEVDQKCPSAVKSGEVVAMYPGPEGNRALTVLWTGCGQSISRLAMSVP